MITAQEAAKITADNKKDDSLPPNFEAMVLDAANKGENYIDYCRFDIKFKRAIISLGFHIGSFDDKQITGIYW